MTTTITLEELEKLIKEKMRECDVCGGCIRYSYHDCWGATEYHDCIRCKTLNEILNEIKNIFKGL